MIEEPWPLRSQRPNCYSSAPEGRGPADRVSPVFPVPLAELERAWLALAAALPRFELVRREEAAHRYDYVARSRVLGFPDDIAVQFVALGGATASLAIASRSRYGYYDFGVNPQRVDALLAALAARLKPAPGPS